jgi:alkyl hydroperoxide reductase subunit AhpF
MVENKLLSKEIIQQVGSLFAQMKETVQVIYFGKQEACDYCDETLQLLTEVTDISEKLDLSVYDLNKNPEVAAQFGVDKAPGFVLAGKDGDRIIDYGVRYAGIPAGHEFSSLIHDIVRVSERDSGLDKKTRQFLSELEQPVHLLVFATPT